MSARRGFRRHGGGEEQRLPQGRQHADDLLDIGDEAHVEHAVGFVDHQQAGLGQQQAAALEQVDQPARGRDQHVDAAIQRVLLLGHALAADQQRVVQFEIFAVFDEILGHLECQFARRLQDQRARHASPVPGARQDSSIGRVKPAVLPVPVWATPSTSRPISTYGMAWAWIGVGWM
jgi:hypothetical protein